MVCPHSMSDSGLWLSKPPGLFCCCQIQPKEGLLLHNCWQQLSTRWFTAKTCFNFLQNGLEAFIWKVKADLLACYLLPLGPNSAQLAVCSDLTPNSWCSPDHVSLEGFKPCGQPQHRLKTKGHTSTGVRQRLTQIFSRPFSAPDSGIHAPGSTYVTSKTKTRFIWLKVKPT